MKTFCLLIITLISLSAHAHGKNYQTTIMAKGLDQPWALAFLPKGGFLITQRSGDLFCFDVNGKKTKILGTPNVWQRGQGGLLDVIVDTNFAQTQRIFLTYADPHAGGGRTAVGVGKLDCSRGLLKEFRQVFSEPNGHPSGYHFGSRILQMDQDHILISVGDRGTRNWAQIPHLVQGKMVKIRIDGTGYDIWSLGHRNPQGLTRDIDGHPIIVEHGPQGGDEINKPKYRKNYGWPLYTFGEEYGGGLIGPAASPEGFEPPLFQWTPSIAPSGLMVYKGNQFPSWYGHIFTGSLKFNYISRIVKTPDGYQEQEKLLEEQFARIRDVREAPDGSIWFLAEADGMAVKIAVEP
ncbi:MAG: PQQ-dependent sugar dehydrogenase [Alphaproteobacteria bacterium]